MTEWENTEASLGLDAYFFASGNVEDGRLNDVRNDIVVRDHDCFLKGRG